jgi:hypothetical protein
MSLGGAASAASITFGSYVSSNGTDKLSPLVTISDDPVGSFLVTVTHAGTSDGHLNLIAFDLGTASVVAGGVTNVKNDGVSLAYQATCTNTGQNQVKTGKYCFGTTVPVGGNSNNLNPFDTSAFDFALAFFNNDSIGDAGSTLTFNLSDNGGTLTLSSFASVGLRYQSANNRAGSDKLVGTPVNDTSPVPLPASALLLLGGLGGLGATKRFLRRV